MDRENSQNKFTTGMLAQVWHMHPMGTRRVDVATARLVQIKYRLERAQRMLQKIEQRTRTAETNVEQTERRFNALKDSFYALQKEWKEWKKEQDSD